MANPLDPTFSPLTSRTAAPPLPTAEDYAMQIRAAGLAPRQGFVEEPEMPSVRTARLAYSPSLKQFFVGGYTFDDDNDTAAVTMSKYANQEAPLPEGDWQEIDPASYAQYVEGIRSPGFFQQIANNFDIGLDEMQQTLGYGLMFAGAEETGRWLADQESDLAKTQIYQRRIEDIGENGVLDWIAATIGRFGPNVVESVITAGAGAALGSAATPAGTAGGAVLGFFGKTAVKKALYEAAKKQFKGQALDAAEKKLLLSAAGMVNTASNAAKTRLAPGAFNQFMDEGLQAGAEAVAKRVAARAPTEIGAVGLSTASNIFQQTGQAYGETMAGGGPGDRAVALGVGTIGGLADTAGEFLLAGRVFSEAMGDVAGSVTKRQKALNLMKRVGAGAGVGAGMEGTTEAFQEALQIAANPVVNIGTPEGQSRLLNALAGGALLGGGFGGAGGIFAGNLASNKQETNLLLPVSQSDPNYAQYREDVKRQLGEAEYNKVFGPPQPYTQLMEQEAAAAKQQAEQGVQAAEQASAEADWQRLFGYVPATQMQTFPPPAEPFAAPTAAQPQGEMFPGVPLGAATVAPPVAAPPVVTPSALAQGDLFAPPRPSAMLALPPASTIYVPPTGPGQIGPPPTPESDWQRLFGYVPNTENLAPTPRTPQGELLLRGGRGRAPARVPPSPTPEPSVDLGGVQGILQPRREFPATYGVSSAADPVNTQLAEGLVPFRRQMEFEQARQQAATNRVTPAERDYAEAMIGQSITLDIDAVVSPNKLGKRLTPNERDRRKIVAGFNSLKLDQQERILVTFNNDETQLLDYVRREKPPVVRRQFATLARVPETTFEVAIPKPLKEEANAPKPGAGTGSAAPAGEQGGEDRGTGKGRDLRQGAAATRKKPASEAQGPAARSEQAQAEEAIQPAVAEAKAQNDQKLKKGKKTDLQQFVDTYADPRSFGGMRENENLADVVEYADWLGSLSKAQLAKIEPVFSKRDNPFLNAGSMDVARARAKLEEALSPKAPEGAAPSKEAAETKAEKARKAAEAKRVKDVGRVNKAIVDANNANADERVTLLAAVARLGADEKLSPEARALAQDHIATELSELETILLNARLADLGYKDLSPDDKAELAADAIRGSKAVQPNMVPESELDEVYSAIATVRQQSEEMTALAGKGNDTPAKREEYRKNFLSLMSWAVGPGVSEQAQWTARAYLEEYKGRISQDWAGVEQALDDINNGRYMLSQFDAVENPIDENGRPAKGVNPLRVKTIVDNFKRGLAKAPTFHVYKNQADLQRRNPTLYQQAVGSRPQGDFDTARASGFAFDGKVIVFTDRIPTEKYMRLLLAHESIGHFGMRALLPASKFDALMDYVYENNMAVRRAADSKLAGSTDLGARREAVEEYMAKYAEKLDSSVLTRVWNAIKDVLNKLGIKFEDDIVRYLVSQARRTVREGSSMFTPSTFALNVHTITTNNGTGRFSTEPILTDQHAASNAVFLMDAPPANIERASQTLKDFKIDSADKFERFVRTFLRQGNVAALRNHGVEYHQNLLQSMATAAKELVFRFNQRLGALLALNGNSRRMVSNAFVVSRRIANRRYALPKDLRDKALLILGDTKPDGTREIKGDEEVIKKLVAIGTLSKKELEDGATVTYEEPTEGGEFKKVTQQIPGLKELLKRELTQEEYDLYKKTREDLAALDTERLIGQYQNFLATEEISTKGIRKVLADKSMTEEDVTFVKGIVNHAKNLFISEIDYDERGIANITPKGAGRMEQYFAAINTAVVKKEFTDDLKAEVRKFYLPEPTRDEDGKIKEPSAEALAEGNKKSEAAIKRIEAFRSRRTEFTGKEEQSVIYTLQDRVKEIVLADAAFDKAQAAVRRSIASSHVPLWREGAWQVRVEAQINGKPQKLHPEVQNKMILSLHEKPSEAENVAAIINEKMKGLEYSGLVYNEETGEYKTQTFKLFAVPSKTVDSVASDPSIDIDNLLYTLRVLGQPLTPDKHAKAITMLTAPGSALRKALRFDDSPGYDPNRTIDAIARHVTTRASLIAKTRYQPVMRELLDRTTELGQKWFGDKEAVMTAKENLDKATTDDAKKYWQDKLTTDLYKYVTTNPGAKGWDGSRATFPNQPTKASLGMRDYSDAVKTTEWVMGSANINESTFEGKRYAALLKMITSVGFLGGMLTQFGQNIMSFPTNVLPLLASKDSQTGYGGGFGFAVMPMYLRSFKDANFTGFSAFSDPIKEAQAFDKIATEIKAARDAGDKAKEAELVQQYNLSYYEALNIAREIRGGKLIPSQALAILETARGIFTGRPGKFFLKFSDWYMLPFNVSEQATRRASFLTAFRLEFDRLVKAGFNEDKASEMARVFAVKIIDGALGNYDASNRPPIWRDGLMSMLFVYKTYPLTSLSLFKNLSRNGKIGMLTALWVMAGAAGFPLVDDMEDFIDTLAQRLGLDLGQGPSIRMAIIQQLEEVFPGWSDFILRGPMNHYTGADVGAKFGLEDFIPGTGIFLKGANTTEELKDIGGPVLGMGLSIGKFAYDAIRAPLSSTVSLTDVARESPFSLMRAGGDVAAYLQNGAVVDRRGYIVTPEVSAMTMVSRLLGFYPAEAAKQYDFIKYANRMNYDYKEVGMAYKLAWVKAKMAGDERQAARIVREVNEWNEANRGGPGVIRNFLKNAQRALKEARRPAGERFLKSAPVASRAEYDRFLQYITGE